MIVNMKVILDYLEDDSTEKEKMETLRLWAESIIEECSDKAGRDVWEYVQQVKEQIK